MKSPSTILIINSINDPRDPKSIKEDYLKIQTHLPNSSLYFCTCSQGDCKTCLLNIEYDLVYLCDLTFSFNLIHPLSICESEIIFKRTFFNFEVFVEGLWHYAVCEKRNGR